MTKPNTYDMQIANRLKLFRTKFIHEKQEEASHLLNNKISQASFSNMEAGRRGVGIRAVNALTEKYRLNPEWLATGEGDMQLKKAPETGGLMGKTLKELTKQNQELQADMLQLKKSIKILEANQNHFIKLIEKFMDNQGK